MAATAFFSTLSFSVYRLIFEKGIIFTNHNKHNGFVKPKPSWLQQKTCYQINKKKSNKYRVRVATVFVCVYLLVRHLSNLHKKKIFFSVSQLQHHKCDPNQIVRCKTVKKNSNMSKSDATEEEFSVEKVLNRRVRNGKVSYFFFSFFIIPFLWCSFWLFFFFRTAVVWKYSLHLCLESLVVAVNDEVRMWRHNKMAIVIFRLFTQRFHEK